MSDDRTRIGDAERDSAVAALGEHYALGRLTVAEHEDRTRRALEARTAADLTALFTDLPHPGPVPGGAARASGPRLGGAAGSRRGPRVPWVPLAVLLVVLTVVTHLPWILLGVAVWFLVAGPRHRWGPHPSWAGHGPGAGVGVRRAGGCGPRRG